MLQSIMISIAIINITVMIMSLPYMQMVHYIATYAYNL